MHKQIFNRQNPFKASIIERVDLCHPESKKKTMHVVLDLKGSNITYDVGDSIAIFPQNERVLVQKTLNASRAADGDLVSSKQTEQPISFGEFLTSKANLSEVNRKLFAEIAKRQTNVVKKSALDELQKEENRAAFKEYIECRHVWDFLAENEEVALTPQELVGLLMPLLPRFYSISSSQKRVGDEVHLTVALLRYESNGHERVGTCTHYLCHDAPLYEAVVPVYIQPHHGFTLPEDPHAKIIMIGPGTGIAPYRAFMQERLINGSQGHNWLFFGEWNRSHHFFYQSFWEELVNQKKLRVDLAFSRDQEHKVYVQHRMQENGAEFFHWIDQGAYIYVCGDAKRMARDVENALLEIIREHGNKSESDAHAYLKNLRSEKRYLRDVY